MKAYSISCLIISLLTFSIIRCSNPVENESPKNLNQEVNFTLNGKHFQDKSFTISLPDRSGSIMYMEFSYGYSFFSSDSNFVLAPDTTGFMYGAVLPLSPFATSSMLFNPPFTISFPGKVPGTFDWKTFDSFLFMNAIEINLFSSTDSSFASYISNSGYTKVTYVGGVGDVVTGEFSGMLTGYYSDATRDTVDIVGDFSLRRLSDHESGREPIFMTSEVLKNRKSGVVIIETATDR
jgi:hypothetical protein